MSLNGKEYTLSNLMKNNLFSITSHLNKKYLFSYKSIYYVT